MKKAISIILVIILVGFFMTTSCLKLAMRAEVNDLIKTADWYFETESAVFLNYENGACKMVQLKEPLVEIVESFALGAVFMGIAIWATRVLKKV